MIKINTTTNTEGGLIIGSSSLLNVEPHFMDYIDGSGLTKYNISFDVDIYKDLAGYLSKKVLVKDYIKEYNIGYTINNVDIQGLTSVSGLIGLLATHIENGDSTHSGIGTGNTSIYYPPVV